MASLNKAILIGNLGRDPEMRYMQSGEAIANIAVATTETWKDKGGERQEKTEWHRVSAFGKLAEIIGQYLKKGAQVYIEGKIQTRKWTDKDGQDRYTTEIVAHEMKMLGGRRDDDDSDDRPTKEQQRNREAARSAPPMRGGKGGASGGSNGFDGMDDDIPFGTNSLARDVIWKKLRGCHE